MNTFGIEKMKEKGVWSPKKYFLKISMNHKSGLRPILTFLTSILDHLQIASYDEITRQVGIVNSLQPEEVRGKFGFIAPLGRRPRGSTDG